MYVKISELETTSNFGTSDEFVIVQDGETVKIAGNSLASSLATLTNLATRSYVDAIVDMAPETLDTLRELAEAINNDPGFATTITQAINTKITAEDWEELWGAKDTSTLIEGSNLYFTEERVLDIVNPLLEGFSPVIGNDPVFNSVTTTQLNVQNVEFTGTGAVNFVSGNDLNFEAAGNISFNGEQLADVATSGSYNDLTNKPALNVLPSYSTSQLNAMTSVVAGTTAFWTDSLRPVYFDGTVWRDFLNNDINGGPDDFSAPLV